MGIPIRRPYDPAGVYPGPRSTPTIDGEYVYFTAPNGLAGCLTLTAGELIWSINVVETWNGHGAEFGYSCSPTVIDGLVILPVGGEQASMVALHAATGELAWKSGSDPASYTPAYPINVYGQPLVVGYLQNSLTITNRSTGRQVARMDLSAGYDEHSAWPIFHDEKLWLSGPFRSGCSVIDLSVLDAGSNPASGAGEAADIAAEVSEASLVNLDGAPVWKSRLLSNDVTSSVLVDGYLYGFDLYDAQSKVHRPSRGKFVCLSYDTGELQWEIGTGRVRRNSGAEHEIDDSQPDDGSLDVGQCGIVVAENKLIILDENGDLIVARANPDHYEELCRATVLGGELTWTPPALHRGRVYLRNHSRAVCVYVGDPELLQPTSQPLLTVSDVPQTQYRDLAGMILAVEPEYAFDAPTSDWLWNSYLAGTASLIAAMFCGVLVRRLVSVRAGLNTTHSLALVLGMIGTTVLSRSTGEFIFTWPLCLFVAFDMLVGATRLRSTSAAPPAVATSDQPGRSAPCELHPTTSENKARQSGLRSRFVRLIRGYTVVVFFLLTSTAYFLMCRRLSLVFEWVWLMAYPAALPFSLLTACCRRYTDRLRTVIAPISSIISWTLFYTAGALILSWKY